MMSIFKFLLNLFVLCVSDISAFIFLALPQFIAYVIEMKVEFFLSIMQGLKIRMKCEISTNEHRIIK